MNTRERFTATVYDRPSDRAPVADFGFWEETIPIWHELEYRTRSSFRMTGATRLTSLALNWRDNASYSKGIPPYE